MHNVYGQNSSARSTLGWQQFVFSASHESREETRRSKLSFCSVFLWMRENRGVIHVAEVWFYGRLNTADNSGEPEFKTSKGRITWWKERRLLILRKVSWSYLPTLFSPYSCDRRRGLHSDGIDDQLNTRQSRKQSQLVWYWQNGIILLLVLVQGRAMSCWDQWNRSLQILINLSILSHFRWLNLAAWLSAHELSGRK